MVQTRFLKPPAINRTLCRSCSQGVGMRAALTSETCVTPARVGFSMVELVVAMAIIGALLAILLPAVQSARGSARRLTCESHLRQLMIAGHSYQEMHSVYPVSMFPFRRLLPFVEQSAVYERLERGESTDLAVALYLCPDDPQGQSSEGNVSYLINNGSGKVDFVFPNRIYDGVCPGAGLWSRPRDITDGLSQTAFFSERKVVPNDLEITAEMTAADPNRYIWYVGRAFTLPLEFPGFRDACSTARTTAVPHLPVPSQYHLQQNLGYNHALTPNLAGCHNGVSTAVPPYIDVYYSILPPTSFHTSGVNVAFADGHVRFVSDNIDALLWQAISTRNGNESVGDF